MEGILKPHRLRGLASEYAFASQYYELIDDEEYSLISPTLDTGWDFMVAKNNIKIQVKRHNVKVKNTNVLDIRRKRNKGTGNYTGKEFDYIAIHDTIKDEFIIANISQLMNKDGKLKTAFSVRSLVNEGFEVLIK